MAAKCLGPFRVPRRCVAGEEAVVRIQEAPGVHLGIDALPRDANVLRAPEARIRAEVAACRSVVCVPHLREVVVAPLGLHRLVLGLSGKVVLTLRIKLRAGHEGTVNADDTLRVLSLEDVHALSVVEDLVAICTPLLLRCLHVQMLLVPLRWQLQGVVLVQLDELDVHFRWWVRVERVQGAFPRVPFGVVPSRGQVRHVDCAGLLVGPRHTGLVCEAHRRPHLAVGGHLPDETVPLRRSLAMPVACVSAAQEAIQPESRVCTLTAGERAAPSSGGRIRPHGGEGPATPWAPLLWVEAAKATEVEARPAQFEPSVAT
mmetsp:Transcript_97210/g.208518  ORF Transcript_97210/g.208518 Transcript_97210/m.208518 type:complete len:316 (+) Transcript_97210:226-1173(+)